MSDAHAGSQAGLRGAAHSAREPRTISSIGTT